MEVVVNFYVLRAGVFQDWPRDKPLEAGKKKYLPFLFASRALKAPKLAYLLSVQVERTPYLRETIQKNWK